MAIWVNPSRLQNAHIDRHWTEILKLCGHGHVDAIPFTKTFRVNGVVFHIDEEDNVSPGHPANNPKPKKR